MISYWYVGRKSSAFVIVSTPLDGVTYRQVRDVVQSETAIVVVLSDEREKYVFLEDERLRLLGVPLGPVNPETLASVGV